MVKKAIYETDLTGYVPLRWCKLNLLFVTSKYLINLEKQKIIKTIDKRFIFTSKTNFGHYRGDLCIDGVEYHYLLHQIIWIHCHGLIPEGYIIDHKDNNPSNNNITNLRLATYTQNQANRQKQDKTSSMFKGVYWNKKFKKWCAQIQKDGKSIYLGLFTNEIDGAIEYNKKAKEIFGKFAKLNNVNPPREVIITDADRKTASMYDPETDSIKQICPSCKFESFDKIKYKNHFITNKHLKSKYLF